MDAKFNAALREVCLGESAAALVTITRVKGSTPRKPGAKMLILPDGQTFGTIGGGCGEAEVRQQALNAMDNSLPTTYWVNLTNDVAEEEGMVCGGIMEVFIDVLPAGKGEGKQLLAAYLDSLAEGEEPVLVTLTGTSGTPLPEELPKGSRWFIRLAEDKVIGSAGLQELIRQGAVRAREQGKTFVLQTGETLGGTWTAELLFEPAPSPVELLILGGGHIALPLATMGKILGYNVTVIDDRPSFANKARFPSVDRVICGDFAKSVQELNPPPGTFVVIVTRGHRHDKVCLQEVVARPFGYVGMIGSRRRVKALLEELEAEGFPSEVLKQINAPIGLDIGAETPEEIAVSILAELVNVHRSGKAESLKLYTQPN